MPGPWGALLGTLAYNYSRHRRGLPTICSVGRRVLHTDTPVGTAAFVAGLVLFADHILLAPARKESCHVLMSARAIPATRPARP